MDGKNNEGERLCAYQRQAEVVQGYQFPTFQPMEAVMYTNIVVAMKFSATGYNAVYHALRLARAHDAFLHVFHALDYKLLGHDPGDKECELKCLEYEDRFRQEVKPMFNSADAVTFICKPADPAMGICRLARDLNADLIIIGCHQRIGVQLGRLDYTGTTILETAPCPVMLVPHFEGKPGDSCLIG